MNRARATLLRLLALPLLVVAGPAAGASHAGDAHAGDSAGAARAGTAVVHPDVARRLHEGDGLAKVWVFFTDKGHVDAAAEAAAVQALQSGFPERTLLRRALRRTLPGLLDGRDLPVALHYVTRVEELAGAGAHAHSRWLNAISVTVDARGLARLAELPFVSRIQLVGRSAPRTLPAAPLGSGPADGGAGFYGFAQEQLDLIDIPALHAAGHTGSGVVIGVLDTGFRTTHAAFHAPGHELQVVAAYDFVDDDAEVGPEPGDDPDQHFHGTFILGELGAYLPGELVGAAYDAAFILAKTEDATSETPVEEDFYVEGLEFIEFQGGDVATSSLGYIDWYTQADLDGLTAVTTQAVNLATANGVHCCTAAGNGGHDLDPLTSTLLAPSDAFDVLACGAVEPTQEYASFTADGPTADGRVKPEIMATGTQVKSVWPYDDVQIAEAAGTSTATPLLAGVVACLASAHPGWGIATMRERIIKSGSYLGEPLPDPLGIYGWGIVDADLALTLAGTWVTLGGGVAGAGGLPVLAGTGPLVGGEVVTLTLAKGPPSGVAFLVLGFMQVNAPFKGGVLVPSVNVLSAPLPLNGAGALALATPWPSGLPAATKLWLQAWMPDASAPSGLAGSNGLKATTP
jgi:subtilisin family serine protease